MNSYIIVGNDPKKINQTIKAYAPIPVALNSPDCVIINDSSIGIDQVRQIHHFLSRKPYQEPYQLVIVNNAQTMSPEAQNALLKVLEEPPEHAVIILTAPNEQLLLPTIVSRCQIVKVNISTVKENKKVVELLAELQVMTVGQKISWVTSKNYSRPEALALCKDLLLEFRQRLYREPSPENFSNLSLIDTCLQQISRNIDVKLALENLFLSLRFPPT